MGYKYVSREFLNLVQVLFKVKYLNPGVKVLSIRC